MTTTESRLLGLVADAWDHHKRTETRNSFSMALREAARSAGGGAQECDHVWVGSPHQLTQVCARCHIDKPAAASTRPTRGEETTTVEIVAMPGVTAVTDKWVYEVKGLLLGMQTPRSEELLRQLAAFTPQFPKIDALNRVARPVEGEAAGSNPAAPGLDESRDCPDVVAQSGRAAQTGGPGSIPGDVRENASVGGEHAGPNFSTLQDASHVPPMRMLKDAEENFLHHESPSQEGRAGELRAEDFLPPVSDEVLEEEVGWVILLALHRGVPEAERPQSWSDMDEKQEARIRAAARSAIKQVRLNTRSPVDKPSGEAADDDITIKDTRSVLVQLCGAAPGSDLLKSLRAYVEDSPRHDIREFKLRALGGFFYDRLHSTGGTK